MHNMREEYATYNIRNIREYMHNIREKYAYKTCIAILVVFVLFCMAYFKQEGTQGLHTSASESQVFGIN